MPPPHTPLDPHADARRWGTHLGTVTRTDDPEPRRMRVEVRCEDIAPEPLGWAEARNGSWGPQSGRMVLPAVGSQVLVTFLGGDPSRPLWEPGPWREADVPDEVSTDGDASGERRAHLATDRGLRVIEEPDGRVEVVTRDRAVHLDTGSANLALNVSESGGKNAARAGDATVGHTHTVHLAVVPGGAPGSYVIVASPTPIPNSTPVTIPSATDTIAEVASRKVLV